MERAVYRGLLLFGATVLAVWAFWQILAPFMAAIAWALCLAAISAKPYTWLESKLKRPRLASGLMVLAVAVVILGPMIGVGILVIDEASQIDFSEAKEKLRTALPGAIEWANQNLDVLGIGTVSTMLDTIQEQVPEMGRRIFGRPFAEGAISVVTAPFVFLFYLVVTLVTLYFVYREAPRLRALVIELSPLTEPDTDRILQTLHRTTSAAVLGGVVVAIIQGALGGIAFVVAGIQSPVLWSMVMAGFSLLPFGGTALVWVPAGVYLIVTGDTFGGWFVLLWGSVVVGLSDNLLRPLVLRRTGARDIHPMLLFFAILSGIGLFGISGIVFGPLLLGFLITVVRIYREHGPGARAEEAAHTPGV